MIKDRVIGLVFIFLFPFGSHGALWDRVLEDVRESTSDITLAESQASPAQSGVSDVVIESANPAATQAGGTGDIVTSTEIDGITLGMPIEDALNSLAANGYEMGMPSQQSKLTGITIEGKATEPDGSGYIEITIREMNGIVYWYQKSVAYLLNRLPEGTTVQDLEQRYREKFVDRFAGARYSDTLMGAIHFDDESQPPYNRKITSPHARIVIGENKRSGRFSAQITIEWKEPVGLSW